MTSSTKVNGSLFSKIFVRKETVTYLEIDSTGSKMALTNGSERTTSFVTVWIPLFIALVLVCAQQGVHVRSDDFVHKRIRGSSTKNRQKKLVGTVDAVYDLIDRVLKDSTAKDSICLSIVEANQEEDEKPWFRLEQQNRGARCETHEHPSNHHSLHDNSTDDESVVIAITATSASELTAGLGHYFTNYCNFTIEWSANGRAGGSNIFLPEIWPVPLPEPIFRTRTTEWSYLMNVCTHSYSLVWYDWNSWQTLIDNMALRGINMVLALTGQEEIQHKVFTKLGLQDQDIRSWFNGPAFLTWSRGQNEYGSGIAGPLPRSFMKNQWKLQKEHILPRLRSLGMVGILPAFQGNVPIQLKELYKDANITQQDATGWMNALDPLYAKVADLWMTQLIEDFGTDQYYQLDGWFNGGVPPWMGHQEKKQHSETVTVTERRSLTTLENQQVMAIPHDEGWYQRGQAAYSGLNRTDPDAHWMYQGFAFVGWSTPEQASYVKGFVDSVPEGKFILIDMEYSPEGQWQYWKNASFFGAVSALRVMIVCVSSYSLD